MDINDLKQKRTAAYAAMKDLSDRAKREARSMTADEDTSWNKAYGDYRSYDNQVKTLEVEIEEQRSAVEHQQPKPKQDVEGQKAEARQALKTYLLGGKNALNAEQRSILFGQGTGILLPNEKRLNSEQRAQSSVTANLGAELVREEYFNEFERYMVAHSGMMEACRVIRTSTGGNLPWPGINDTANKGRRIAQNASTNVLDIPTLEVNIGAHKYTSDAIIVPSELEQDDAYGLIAEIPSIAAERVARIFNEEATITASGGPDGIASTAGNSGVTVVNNTISRTKLIDLIHSINPAYRRSASCRFMFSDATLRDILKLSIGSADDSPIWQPSMREGVPDRINGYAFVINDAMPDLGTTGNRAVLFGDFSKYIIRIVRDFNLRRANELHIQNDQIGFYGFARMDGKMINPNAIKYMATVAS